MRATWFIGKFELLLNCTKYPIYSPKSRTPQQPQHVSCKHFRQHRPYFETMKNYFADFDLTNFWNLSILSIRKYNEKYLSEEIIFSIENEVGFKLPDSYIELMKSRNGGIPINTCFPTNGETSYSATHIEINGFFGIGREAPFSICGEFGNNFFIKNLGYPNIGICICDCDCTSDGHDIVMLDYSRNGKNHEPEVVHIDQELNYKKTFLAKNFKEFIKGLVNKSVYDTSDEDRKRDLFKVEHGSFSSYLSELCNSFNRLPNIETIIRNVAKEVVNQKGYFALYEDELSYLLYDIQFWMYTNNMMVSSIDQFLDNYNKIMTLNDDGEFTIGSYDPDFIKEWINSRCEQGIILKTENYYDFSAKYKLLLADKMMCYDN